MVARCFSNIKNYELCPGIANGDCINLANILKSEEKFPKETDLYINAEELTFVFLVSKIICVNMKNVIYDQRMYASV